jgi:hypothetical protein
LVVVTNAGRVFHRQEAFTEIGSGICYLNPATGQFEDASPGFRIENGRAIADRSRHVLSVGATLDDPEGFLQCRLPDGKMFRSAVLGIWVYDPVTGNSLQISSPRTGDAAVVGEQTAPSAITWSDAFEGMLRASLRVRNEVGQFHHDVVLNEKLSEAQLKRLEELGFGPEMRIEVVTEILASPPPSVQTVTLRSESDPARRAAMVEPDLTDAVVQFGSAALGPGVGFADDDSGRIIPIARQLLQRDHRTVLIEAARYVDLLPLVAKLPASRMTVMNRTPSNSRMFAERPRRQETLVAGVSKPMSIAPLDATARRPREAEVTIDFSLLQGSLTNFCFDGQTFYVTAPVILYGAASILPQSVIKFAPTNSARLVLQPGATLQCPSGAYQRGVITVRDDDKVGTQLPGSDGVPERASIGIYGSSASITLRNLRFSHLIQAVSTTSDVSVLHCQFVDCGSAINAGTSVDLQNVLFAECEGCVGLWRNGAPQLC